MPNFGQGQVEDPELAAGEGVLHQNFNFWCRINHPSTICQTYGAGRNILNISRIKI